MEEAVCLLEDGDLQHVPNITHARAFEMYAPPSTEDVRGKLTKRRLSVEQRPYSDVMHVDGEKFHISVTATYVWVKIYCRLRKVYQTVRPHPLLLLAALFTSHGAPKKKIMSTKHGCITNNISRAS
jgi:hypothetical protein